DRELVRTPPCDEANALSHSTAGRGRLRTLDGRRLIHDLNQRYRREWNRAERLQAELNAIHGSRGWRLLALWQKLKAFWRRTKTPPVPSPFRFQPIAPAWPSASGTVSIIIPF